MIVSLNLLINGNNYPQAIPITPKRNNKWVRLILETSLTHFHDTTSQRPCQRHFHYHKRKLLFNGFRTSKMRPTKRAPDVWESARFTSLFLASSFFCSQTESTPAHTQVTQTVRRFFIKRQHLKEGK